MTNKMGSEDSRTNVYLWPACMYQAISRCGPGVKTEHSAHLDPRAGVAMLLGFPRSVCKVPDLHPSSPSELCSWLSDGDLELGTDLGTEDLHSGSISVRITLLC